MQGAVVVHFGANWCGICQAAAPLIESALADSSVREIKVEDGPGRKLGRSFGIKLWPTLVFLEGGEEVTRVVRPTSRGALDDALAQVSGSSVHG